MDEELDKKLNEVYSTMMSKPNQVLEIFNNFFGEDKVDMQEFPSLEQFKAAISIRDSLMEAIRVNSISGCVELIHARNIFHNGFILVYFPHVRVTNEYDRYIDITELYVKVRVAYDGTIDGRFTLNRAEYTYAQMASNYMHSHISSIPFNNFTSFQIPCLGRGPINDTIANLAREFDPDIWVLFCLELRKFVEVESIEGVPYKRLSEVGINRRKIAIVTTLNVVNRLSLQEDFISMIRDFVDYFIRQNKLKFDYKEGSYSLGMSFFEYMVTISNSFIEWYNDKFNTGTYTYSTGTLVGNGILHYYISEGGIIYEGEYLDPYQYREYIGKKVCTFKRHEVKLNITDLDNNSENNVVILLGTPIIQHILTKILQVINYRYGRTEQPDSEGHRTSEEVKFI